MKSAGGTRDDVNMTSEEGEGGLHLMWHVPQVAKGERLEVSFDIKGSGEVDAEALNRFHGVHFGDEIESDDMPPAETPDDAPAEEIQDEVTTEDEEPETSSIKFREDMLLRVMEAAGIDVGHRDEFVVFAADYDHDDNGYLKKSELEDAANAWNDRGNDGDEGSADASAEDDTEAVEASTEEAESVPDEASSEATTEEASTEEAAGELTCEVCSTVNPADATVCSACGFDFTSS